MEVRRGARRPRWLASVLSILTGALVVASPAWITLWSSVDSEIRRGGAPLAMLHPHDAGTIVEVSSEAGVASAVVVAVAILIATLARSAMSWTRLVPATLATAVVCGAIAVWTVGGLSFVTIRWGDSSGWAPGWGISAMLTVLGALALVVVLIVHGVRSGRPSRIASPSVLDLSS